MKNAIMKRPELFGALLGVLDAVPRLLAAAYYAPSKASMHGWLILGNVHHENGPKGLGMDTMQWFAIAAVLLAVFLATVHVTAWLLRPANAWFLLARGALGAICGVLLLNVVESLATRKVTDYIGWADGTRVTVLNFGDLLVYAACLLFPLAFAIGLVRRLLRQPVPA